MLVILLFRLWGSPETCGGLGHRNGRLLSSKERSHLGCGWLWKQLRLKLLDGKIQPDNWPGIHHQIGRLQKIGQWCSDQESPERLQQLENKGIPCVWVFGWKWTLEHFGGGGASGCWWSCTPAWLCLWQGWGGSVPEIWLAQLLGRWRRTPVLCCHFSWRWV